jgi:aerobic-type carbon monoxide dehydrogenase small subunit (CoxS/CutS family)
MNEEPTSTYFGSSIEFSVNDTSYTLEVRDHWTVLDVLREQLGLTGSKRGCDRGECGSCTVLLNGMPVYSCQTLAVEAADSSIVTIEGLAEDGVLNALQQAFLDNDGGQCGFCTPGFVISSMALLKENPNPSTDEIKEALSGNICRCNAYGRIIQSVKSEIR